MTVGILDVIIVEIRLENKSGQINCWNDKLFKNSQKTGLPEMYTFVIGLLTCQINTWAVDFLKPWYLRFKHLAYA